MQCDTQVERREKRSENIYEALELQLAATARRAKFSSLVLIENQGIPVAGAGEVAEVEEISAFGPSLAPGKRFWHGNVRQKNGQNMRVTIAPFECEWGQLYLCAAGGLDVLVSAELLLGSQGVKRILA